MAIRADAPVAAPVSFGAGGVGTARKLRANVCPWQCACGLGAGMYAGTSARALPAPAAWAWRLSTGNSRLTGVPRAILRTPGGEV